ncbi:MAG: PD-(D/E)XK nuclease family protein [Verrucomicrobia bacterium]|nr:PD-(D/E)XK nuclease family protein [Verrucomicrobiota bacterium]
MPLPRLHVLPWDQPLVRSAAAWLSAGWSGKAPLDLSDRLVIVPTRQSGRRLREALAALAAVRGQAVFPPKVVLPEILATLEAPVAGLATAMEGQLAWVEVLRGISLDEFRDVFPVDPPARNFAWARRLATQLLRLQGTLAEAGLRIGDVVAVASAAGGGFPESARWRQLGELERRVDAALAARGLRDPQAAKIGFAKAPILPPGIARIHVIGTPDPLPLALSILEKHAARLPVDVLVHGPASEPVDALFDAWGRPRPDAWAARSVAPADFTQRVHLCADPAAQAARIVALARDYAAPDGLLAVGVADAEVLPPLENALTRAGLPAFNPEGRPRRRDGLYALLATLAAFAGEAGFEPAAALLRCPDVLAWLSVREGGAFSPSALLRELDELTARHLPPTLAAARAHAEEFPRVVPALAALAELQRALTAEAFPASAAAALTLIFGARRIDITTPLAGSAEAWTDALREAGTALAVFGASEWTLAEKWELVLQQFAESRQAAEKPPGALDLLGWLELPWEDAPHLVVAGFNDGSVPEAVVGDVFLPEALRVRLGLKTNAVRFARDAYLLAACGASRAAGGRLDLLLGRTSAAGDPRRPSRLLLQCADAELPARVARLFRSVETARPNLPWARAWKLHPRVSPPPARVSVTALKDYLACPFRFYLKHVLRMGRLDPSKAELDALDFGTLVHAALQRLGEAEALRDCTDAAVLRDFLLERFEIAARARYGADLTLPLVVQLESARQRLRAAAEVEARERAAGWRTERVEWPFEFPLGGLVVRGKIDRIDRHADGRVRVLDYKTSDTAKEPAKAHLRPVRTDDAAGPEWRVFNDVAGKARVWSDLQLPLYRRAVAPEWGDAVTCGYFNLPKAAGEAAVAEWADFSRELQAEAERCALGAATAIAAGVFWPPAELPAREDEDWAELFHQGAAASVEWEGRIA